MSAIEKMEAAINRIFGIANDRPTGCEKQIRAALAELKQGQLRDAEASKFNSQRLRNLVNMLGLKDAVPSSDDELLGCMGSVLGMVCREIRNLRDAGNVAEPSATRWIEIDANGNRSGWKYSDDDDYPGHEYVGEIQRLYTTPQLPAQPVSAIDEARAAGRAEAVAIIMQEEAEDPLGDCTVSSSFADTGDYDTNWSQEALNKKFNVGDSLFNMMAQAEEEYYHNMGLRGEAQRMLEAQTVSAQDAKDAERYQWLRHGDNDEIVLQNGPVDMTYWYLPRNEKLDEMIDVAIAAQKEWT